MPVLTGGYEGGGRYFVYQNGVPLSPTVPKREGIYKYEFVTPGSSTFGPYEIEITLLHPENYVWGETDNAGAQPNEELEDYIREDAPAVLVMWYRITKDPYICSIDIKG